MNKLLSLKTGVVVILLIFFHPSAAGQGEAKPHEHMESAQPTANWIDPLVPPNDLLIKGAETPEVIPLSHCYNAFFRLLGRVASQGDEGRAKARDLLRKTGVLDESIERLLFIAGDYESKVSAIDAEAETKKAEYRAQKSTETAAVLYKFDEQKQAAALALLAAAAQTVGYLEAQKVHFYIDNVVRRQIVLGGADAARVLNSRSGATQTKKE